MGKIDGFLSFTRSLPDERSAETRIKDYKEIYKPSDREHTIQQAARCMDCGIPFCHHGCPLGNNIPEFNDAVYNEEWKEAYEILKETNNFPEFTGRLCPAPCEGSCVLGINKPQVTIEYIEKAIAEVAFESGYVSAQPPMKRTGKKVAVIGSGPAGLAAADELNKAGHQVTVFERDDKIGGLLRYGIPDFKLEKWVIDRRLKIMEAEGVKFKINSNVGENVDANQLVLDHDAVVLCGGSTIPRDLPIEGRDLQGIHFAMEFLTDQNREISGTAARSLDVSGKHVIVIGGGDTGSDCVGTSNRQGAASVTQIELLPKPPKSRAGDNPWPEWPMILRTSSSHDEGVERDWSILTEAFIGDEEGNVKALKVVDIKWAKGGFEKVEGTERELPCDAIFLAMGFVHPQKEGMLAQLKVDLDDRSNVKTDSYQTNVDKIFAAGDMRRGQSLIVWAIAEGRQAAEKVDEYLLEEQKS